MRCLGRVSRLSCPNRAFAIITHSSSEEVASVWVMEAPTQAEMERFDVHCEWRSRRRIRNGTGGMGHRYGCSSRIPRSLCDLGG